MVRLRTFFLAVTSAIVLLTTAVLYLQAEGVLSQMFLSLEEVNQETVKNTSQSIVETRLYSLRTFRGTIENDNSLSSEWLLSRHSGQTQSLKERVTRLQQKIQTDLLDLSDGTGASLRHGRMGIAAADLTVALSGKSREILTEVDGTPYLVSLSALRNFGEPVAVLVLGYALNQTVAPQVSATTHTEVKFALPRTEGSETVTVTDSSGDAISIGFSTSPRLLSNLATKTRRKFLILGAGSVALLFLLLSLGLELGFVRPFRLLVGSIGSASEDLDREIIQTPDMGRFRISEMETLGAAFTKFTESLRAFSLRVREKTRREAQAEVAEQVAHDLKSPLSALDMMLKADTLNAVPEKGLNRLKACVERIREIVKQLSLQKRQDETASATETRVSWAYSLVDSIVAEKRLQYRSRDKVELRWMPSEESTQLFVQVSGTEFRRALSNLIDNAFQAIIETGTVEILLQSDSSQITVSVTDTGAGLAPEIRSRLFERGATFGKQGGSGLGLFSARAFARTSGGELELSDSPPRGTRADLRLPKSEVPQWFCGQLNLSKVRNVAVLDDDRAIREMWNARLGETRLDLHLFKTPRELNAWWVHLEPALRSGTLFLVDYELHGETLTGLDTVESLGIAKQSVLVTSHCERADIQMRCERLGVRIFPKDLIPLSPLTVLDTEGPT